MLKVPEKFIGVEGACNYCGARLTIQADVVASPPGSGEALPGEAPAPESHSAHARHDLERLAKELESERIARLEAEAAREVAEERVRHLERKVAETISHGSENALLRADLDRVEAKLAQSAREVQRLAEELEAARLTHDARPEAPSTLAHVGPRAAAGRPMSRGTRLVSVLAIVIVVALLLAVSLGRPSTESLRTRIMPILDMLRGKIASKDKPPIPVLPGGLDVAVSYPAPNAQSGHKEAPASDVTVLLIRQRLDLDLLDARLLPATSFAPPEEWFESKSGKDGHVSFVDLEPGRYLVRRAPDMPRENRQPLEPNAANSPDIVTVSSRETAKHTLHVEDTASLIHGEVVDARTAKRVAKAIITLTGDATGGEKVAVPVSNDGSFTVDPKGIGYGSFKIECSGLPKGYLSATDYTGVREAGVRLDSIVIRLSRKPPARR